MSSTQRTEAENEMHFSLRPRGQNRGLATFISAATVAVSMTAGVFAQSISVTGGTTASNSVPTTLDSISVSGTSLGGARSTYNANAALNLSSQFGVSNDGIFNANADVAFSPFSLSAVGSGGTLNLNSGTLSGYGLILSGPAALGQNGGNYAVSELGLYSGVAVTLGSGDSITGNVSVLDGATLALQKAMTLTSGLAVSGSGSAVTAGGNAINLGGSNLILSSGGTITRTASGTITASGFNVSDTNFVIQAGDEFGGGNVSSGGTVTSTATTTLNSISVSGTSLGGARSTYNANAALDLSSQFGVSNDGIFNANADVAFSPFSLSAVGSGGTLNLNSGTLSGYGLILSGPAALGQNGGNYAVGELQLDSGVAVTLGSGDSISSSLSISGAGSLLTANSPLSLSSLSVTSGGELSVTSFTGTWDNGLWALRLDGDQQTSLESYLTQGLLTFSNNPGLVSVAYDTNSNFTYLTAVPEPSTYAMALAGLACSGYSMWRRRKRA